MVKAPSQESPAVAFNDPHGHRDYGNPGLGTHIYTSWFPQELKLPYSQLPIQTCQVPGSTNQVATRAERTLVPESISGLPEPFGGKALFLLLQLGPFRSCTTSFRRSPQHPSEITGNHSRSQQSRLLLFIPCMVFGRILKNLHF